MKLGNWKWIFRDWHGSLQSRSKQRRVRKCQIWGFVKCSNLPARTCTHTHSSLKSHEKYKSGMPRLMQIRHAMYVLNLFKYYKWRPSRDPVEALGYECFLSLLWEIRLPPPEPSLSSSPKWVKRLLIERSIHLEIQEPERSSNSVEASSGPSLRRAWQYAMPPTEICGPIQWRWELRGGVMSVGTSVVRAKRADNWNFWAAPSPSRLFRRQPTKSHAPSPTPRIFPRNAS